MSGAGRRAREIAHGLRLAQDDPESIWGWTSPAGRLRAERRTEMILQGARVEPGSRVLEVGCGSGMFTEKFAASGAAIVALDVSPELIAMAKGRGLASEQVTFLSIGLEDCDIEEPFDAVIGSSVLHHLDLGSALRSIYNLLRPGGWMSFAEPNLLNPQVFAERRFRRFFPYVSPDETAFYRRSLMSSLVATGFDSVEVSPFDWLHPATPERFIPAVQTIGRFLERLWLIREFAGSLRITARRPGN